MAKKNGKSNGMDLLAPHAKAVGLKPLKGESDLDFQERILDKIADLPDDEWEKLPEETQIWANELELKKKELEAVAKKEAKKASKKKKKEDTLAKAKEKAKEKVQKVAAAKPSKVGKVWPEGTAAGQIYQLMVKAGPKGITLSDAVTAAKKAKVNSSNLEGRVKTIFKYAVGRQIATVKDDRYVATAPKQTKKAKAKKA